MKLIGLKRAIILAILLAVNAAIALVYFLQVMPMAEESQRKLDLVNGQIASVGQKISSIKADLEAYKVNLPVYEQLKTKGFTLPQDRFRMTNDLDTVRKRAELAGFKFSISDIRVVPNAEIDAANMQLINRRIKIDQLVSLLDLNFYDFLDVMQRDFPQHVRFQFLDVKRKDPLNPDALGRISRKEKVDLVMAEMQFDWLTIVPKAQEQTGQGPPGGL